jgi:hypothetical protein
MFTERFTYEIDTGSRIQVIDPITNQTKKGYIFGFPSASSTSYFDALWPDKLWPQFNIYSLTRAEYLEKFLVGGSNGFYTSNQSVYVSVLEGRSAWTTASMASGSLPQGHIIENIVCSDELSRCVATVYSSTGGYISSSIIYSNNGYTWYTSSFSKVTVDAFGRQLLDMVWSSETNKFVGLGLSSSLRQASPGFFVTDAKEYTVTSSNGIDWHFTVISQSLTNRNVDYRNLAWSPTHNKFLVYGHPGQNNIYNYSSSLYSSSNGVSWGFVTSHSFGPQNDPGDIYKLTELNGNLIAVGIRNTYESSNYTTLIYTNDLVNWTPVNTKHYSMHNIIYVSQKNKYLASGASGSFFNGNAITIATSSNLINWGTVVVDPRNSINGYENKLVEWSADSSSSVFVTAYTPYWLYDNNNDDFIYYRLDDDDTAYVSFPDELSNSLLNTALTPWTSSIDTNGGYWDEEWMPFNSDSAYSWIELDLAISADFPAGNDSYIPTSSYGIIIDSQSLQYFTSTYYGNFTEDVMIGDIRYLREISQNPGEEYATGNYGYYETPISSTVYNTATSSFSAALKADGRDYVNIYYGIYGDNYMGEECSMILNLNNGTVEYFEDTTNWDAPSSYYMSGPTKLKFLDGPTLTARPNGYWQLQFKVGFDRGDRMRSGSLIMT